MPFDLALDEVHCWSVPLDASPNTLAVLFETLTDDERARAARLRFERDRRRFIVARATLRELLGRYVGTPPDQVRFAYTAFGKPKLTPEFGGPHCIKFNLSHSADLALIAVAWDAEPHAYSRAVADRNAIADRDRNAGGIANRYGDRHSHGHGNRHTVSDSRTNRVADGDTHADCHDRPAGG